MIFGILCYPLMSLNASLKFFSILIYLSKYPMLTLGVLQCLNLLSPSQGINTGSNPVGTTN